MRRYQVLFHINETAKWTALLSNVSNLLGDLAEEGIAIEVVANGPAVIGYLPGEGEVEALAAMAALAERQVDFVACGNSLRARQIQPTALPDWVRVVPAAITELVKGQAKGYIYIKL